MSVPEIVDSTYEDNALRAELQREFLRRGYVRLPGLLSRDALAVLRERVNEVSKACMARSFVMPGFETERRLNTIGGKGIAARDPWLGSLYNNEALRSLIEDVVGQPIHRCQHEQEFMVLNVLSANGQSHGWHLDDPAYAIVMFLESPPAKVGGEVELIPSWLDLCRQWGRSERDDVGLAAEHARTLGHVQSAHHEAGDAYVIHASKVLHRVAALHEDGYRRVVINMAFQSVEYQHYGNTATELYSDAS